jgi:putative nucleotidyltransferase with HDIG domain
MLAEATDINSSEEAFVGGLLHDIGKLILASFFADDYQIVLQLVVEGKDFATAEREIIGADHCEIGQEIAKRWNLPASIIEVIGDHESDTPSALHTTNVVKLGNMMANRVFGGDRRISLGQIFQLADSLLDLNNKDMDELLMALGARAREMQGAFSLNLKDLTQVTKLVEEENLAIASDPSWSGETPHESLLQDIDQITERMISNADTGTVIQFINEAVLKATGTDRVMTSIVDEGCIVGTYAAGSDTADLLQKLRFPYTPRAGALGRTIARSQAFNVLDIRSPLYKSIVSKDDYARLGMISFATVPLIVRGNAIGAMVAGRRAVDSPVTDHEMHTFLLFSRLLSVVLERDAAIASPEGGSGPQGRRTRRSTYARKP